MNDLTPRQAGAAAFRSGARSYNNPHSFGSPEWQAWIAGFEEVRDDLEDAPKSDRRRACYLGHVQRHRLETAVAPINEAFDSMCYLVGSCLTRPDYRDVDVRLILDDSDFMRLFGTDLDQAHGRATALWTNLAVTYSRDLSALTGLEVDFQIQAVTPANAKEPGERYALFVTQPMELMR